jgi:hypothetical protein
LAHKRDLFTYLRQRWQALFHVGFEVLLYDLTSTYFESEPSEGGLRKFGYSRDQRPDGVQVVIALVVTPEGFPLAYEVMPGNTSDKTTLGDFLKRIEQPYGKAQRTWVPVEKWGSGEGARDATAAIETALETPARAPATKTNPG